MKKSILVLVMLITAATAYNQSSRRTTSANTETANRNQNTPTTVTRNSNTSREVNTTAHKPGSSREVNAPREVNTSRDVNTGTYQREHHNGSYESVNHSAYRRPAHSVSHHNHTTTVYRDVYYTYRAPSHVDVIWTADLHRHYVEMYPSHRYWQYSYGYRIASVPAYNAEYYIGDVRKVYGRVTDVYYAPETDEFFLYIGPYFPYQHLTVIVPGHIARNYSHKPARYFMNQDIAITGLITAYEGKPEILVKRNSQMCIY